MADYNPPPFAQDLTFPEWQPQFQAALLETDPKQLPQRVIAAEEAIFTRMQALANAPNGDHEQHAIEDAMQRGTGKGLPCPPNAKLLTRSSGVLSLAPLVAFCSGATVRRGLAT